MKNLPSYAKQVADKLDEDIQVRLSDEIKLELMKYYRFERNYNLVCTEGINNADVNAWSENF